MFYSFIGEKPLEFLEWSVHSTNGVFEWVSGVSTHMKRERWGQPPRGWRPTPLGCHLPPIYWRGGAPLSLAFSLPPLGLSSRCSTSRAMA